MALLTTSVLLCILNTEALSLSDKTIYTSRQEGPFEVHLFNLTECNELPVPDTPVVIKNLTLIKKNGNAVIYYEAEVVGDTREARMNLKTGFVDNNKLVPILNMRNMGCHSPLSSSFLRFVNVKLNRKNCAIPKGIIKSVIDADDLIHKFVKQLWYGIGNFKIEFLRKKNGEAYICVDVWARVVPLTKN